MLLFRRGYRWLTPHWIRPLPAIRRLYRRRSDWTPAWEAHLLRLTERARRRLPLFEP